MKTMHLPRFCLSTVAALILGYFSPLIGTALAQSPYIIQNQPTAISLFEGSSGSIVYSVYNPFNFDLYTYGYAVNNTPSGPDLADTLTGYNFASGSLPYNTVIPAGQSNNLVVNYSTAPAEYGPDSGHSLASIGIQVYTQPNGQGAHFSVQSASTSFTIYDYGMGGVFPLHNLHVDPNVNPGDLRVPEGADGTLQFDIVNQEAYPFTIAGSGLLTLSVNGDASDNLDTVTMMNALNGLEIAPNSKYTVTIDFTTPHDPPEYPPHLDSGDNSVTLDVSGYWTTDVGLVTHDAQGSGDVTVYDTPEPSTFGLQVLGGLATLVLLWRKRS